MQDCPKQHKTPTSWTTSTLILQPNTLILHKRNNRPKGIRLFGEQPKEMVQWGLTNSASEISQSSTMQGYLQQTIIVPANYLSRLAWSSWERRGGQSTFEWPELVSQAQVLNWVVSVQSPRVSIQWKHRTKGYLLSLSSCSVQRVVGSA